MTTTNDGKAFVRWLGFYLRASTVQQCSWTAPILRALYIVILIWCGISGGVLVYLESDDLALNTNVLILVFCAWHTLFVYQGFLHTRAKICTIAETMHDRYQRLSNKLDLNPYQVHWDLSDRQTLTLIRPGVWMTLGVYVFYFISARPFSSHRKSVFPMWVPYSLESDVNYFLTVVLHTFLTWIFVTVHATGQGVAIGGAHFIGASFDVLSAAFKDICLQEGTGDGPIKGISMTEAEEKLRWWVESHVQVLRLTKDYKSVIEPTLVEVTLACEVIICFGGFQAVLAAESSDYPRGLMLAFFTLTMMFHLFLYCYPGQYISNKSKQLRDNLYLSDWEDQSPSFMRSLMIIQRCTIKPVTVSYRGVMDASLLSYMHTIRSAYSLINILMVLRETG